MENYGNIFLIIVVLFAFGLISLLVYFIFDSYRDRQKWLLKILSPYVVAIVRNLPVTSYEEKGGNHNFPSEFGGDSCDVHFGDDFVLFLPNSRFPIGFKTPREPFLIAKNRDLLRGQLSYNNIHTPTRAKFKGRTTTFLISFNVDSFFGKLKMHLSLYKIKTKDRSLFEGIEEWMYN